MGQARPTLQAALRCAHPHLQRLALCVLHEGAGVDDDGVAVLVVVRHGEAGAGEVAQQHLAWGERRVGVVGGVAVGRVVGGGQVSGRGGGAWQVG